MAKTWTPGWNTCAVAPPVGFTDNSGVDYFQGARLKRATSLVGSKRGELE
jgi:hypothetical protein